MNWLVDFHTHILPGIDDGSSSIEESVEMLRMEAAQGIDRVVATPHFYANIDTPEKFLTRRQESVFWLQEATAELDNIPDVITGAEVYFFRGISDCDALSELTIGNGRYLLLEMPPSPWSNKLYYEVEEIYAKRDIIPIIAHVDRYLGLINTFGIPKQLESLPVLVQANANFFLHSRSQSRALRMLAKDQIHLLGSDCHNLTIRQPSLNEVQRLLERHSMPALERISYYQKQVLDEE